MRTCQKCTLEEIVIEGISYLIKQFGTCTPQPCMVERSCCSRCIDLLFERKVMQDHGSINHPISALKVFPIVPVKFAHGNYEKDNFETQVFV